MASVVSSSLRGIGSSSVDCGLVLRQFIVFTLLWFLCRMTLLLGPPGSGKTTLLLALAGRLGNDLKVFQIVHSLPIAKCFSRKHAGGLIADCIYMKNRAALVFL